MRIHNILKDTKGFALAYHAAIRFRDMQNREEVERRAKILRFWKEHGYTATHDAFSVSKRTLYRWSAALVKTGGHLDGLDPKSTAPHKRRSRTVPEDIATHIIVLRTAHPRLGKKKLAPLLRKAGFVISESTAGRYLKDLKARNRIPAPSRTVIRGGTGSQREILPKQRKKRQRRTEKRGIEIDTVVRHIDGCKRYTITAIDLQRRFAYAYTYTNHSSASARDFLKRLIRHAPFEISEIQSDNGSEFARFFHDACITLGITHYHTYPRCPKMNAHVERFNRTISEEFLVYHRALMRDDVDEFNDAMRIWLGWYNNERPHEALGLLSPMEYISSITGMECQRW